VWADLAELCQEQGDLLGAARVLQNHGQHVKATQSLVQLLRAREQVKAGRTPRQAGAAAAPDIPAASSPLPTEVWERLTCCVMAAASSSEVLSQTKTLPEAAETAEAQSLQAQLTAHVTLAHVRAGSGGASEAQRAVQVSMRC
jgi:hypothetical protein